MSLQTQENQASILYQEFLKSCDGMGNLASRLGIPLSTTHTINTAIMGVGAAQRVSAVRWGVAGGIVMAWVLTIPCSAFIAAIAWWLGQQLF